MAASPDATASAASRPRSICRACTAGPAGRHRRRRMPTRSRTSRKSCPPPACSRRSAVKTSGARIVLECLKREGVDTIFGLPGGAVLPIYDALYDFEGLRHILVRQEAAAGHAAEGYARTSGRVGVCLVTSGPAATNLVTALQDALMDSIRSEEHTSELQS